MGGLNPLARSNPSMGEELLTVGSGSDSIASTSRFKKICDWLDSHWGILAAVVALIATPALSVLGILLIPVTAGVSALLIYPPAALGAVGYCYLASRFGKESKRT